MVRLTLSALLFLVLFALPSLVACGQQVQLPGFNYPSLTQGSSVLSVADTQAMGRHLGRQPNGAMVPGEIRTIKRFEGLSQERKKHKAEDFGMATIGSGPGKDGSTKKGPVPLRRKLTADSSCDLDCKRKQQQATGLAASVVIQTDCVGNIQAAAEAVVGAVSGGTEAYAMGLSVGFASSDSSGLTNAFAASLTLATTKSQVIALTSGVALAIASIDPGYGYNYITVDALLYKIAASMDLIASSNGCNAVKQMATSFMYALALVDAQNTNTTNYESMAATFLNASQQQSVLPTCPVLKQLQKRNWDAITSKEAASIDAVLNGNALSNGVGMGRIRKRLFSPCAQTMRAASALSVSIIKVSAPLNADGYCYPSVPNMNLTALAMVTTATNGNCAFASAVSQALYQGIPAANLTNVFQLSIVQASQTSLVQSSQLASSFAVAFVDVNGTGLQSSYANAIATSINGAIRVLGCGSIDGGVQYFVEALYQTLVSDLPAYGPLLCNAFVAQPYLRQCIQVGNYQLDGCSPPPTRRLLR